MRRLVGLAVVGLATLAPTWANADDEQIAQDILEKLQSKKTEGQLKGFGIDLEVENGTVWMKGLVASKHQQQMALDIARRVHGVEKVVNELSVKATESAAPIQTPNADDVATVPEIQMYSPAKAESQQEASPAELGAAPRSKSVSRPKTNAKPISGLASGFARAMTSADKSKPQPYAKAVAHEERTDAPSPVAKIGSATATVDDDRIVQLIANVLRKEKQAGNLKGFNVDLKSEDGVVWVSGYVPNAQQHAKVIDVARRAPGVKQVVNDLKVITSDRGVGTVNHNDPAVPAPEGTGVAQRSARQVPAEDAEELIAPKAISKAPNSIAKTSATQNQTQPEASLTQGQMPQGQQPQVQMIPVQMMQIPYGMYPYPAQMPGYYAQPQRVQTPLAYAQSQMGGAVPAQNLAPIPGQGQMPVPQQMPTGSAGGIAPARYDHPNMPGYAWPSYASHPNYAAVTYPKQYSPAAWPYIGPFYPYPQVPLGWRKVSLEWDDGWWMLDFKDKK